MPDLDQRITDGLRTLVDRAPVDVDVWPATEKYVAKRRRHRRAVVGAAVAVAVLAGAVVAVGALQNGGSKVVVSDPSPTTEPQPVAPSGALTTTGPISGSFTITASDDLSFSPSALTVTTGIYAISLFESSSAPYTLDFDDPATRWPGLTVNEAGEAKTARIFFGRPGKYAFYDAVPGHRAAGMAGTVTVSGTPMTLAQAESAAAMSIPPDSPSGVPAETVVWSIRSAKDVTSASTAFTAYVSRLGCNGGATGPVLQPTIQKLETRVVVTFTVEASTPGAHPCPGNDAVPMVVDLGESLGDRQLVDGACRAGGEAATTAFCADGATRWRK